MLSLVMKQKGYNPKDENLFSFQSGNKIFTSAAETDTLI